MKPLLFILNISLALLIFGEYTYGQASFEMSQLCNSRVKQAKADCNGYFEEVFSRRGMNFDPKNIYLRAFKYEKILEVWVQPEYGGSYTKIKDYTFCASSGKLGPKKVQGDEQIPEGFYFISDFNPHSKYYLSLGINYPNPLDRNVSKRSNLGGNIYIHGGCETIGCIPLTDDKIKELYWLSVKAKDNGQTNIPVHIYPYKFDITTPWLYESDKQDMELQTFWNNLSEGYYYFNNQRVPPFVHINNDGTYEFY